MQRVVYAGGVLILAGLIAWGVLSHEPYVLSTIEIADTPSAREQGLSGRSEVPEGYGMLFIFPQEGNYGFWMKDMKVSIDIIWLSDTGSIVGVEHTVSPASYPLVFYPPVPVRHVLEVRAGTAQERGWEVGTTLALPLR